MSDKYIVRPISYIVSPEGEPIFSEMATTVKIDDEAGGEFIVMQQFGRTDNSVAFNNKEEFEAICNAVDLLLKEMK